MDSSMMDSVFDDPVDSDAFSPVAAAKPKPKAAPKKAVAAAKPKATSKATKPAAAKKAGQAAKPKAAAAGKKRSKPDTEDENSDPEMDSLLQDSILSTTPPSAKKPKTTAATKKAPKTTANPLTELANMDGASKSPAGAHSSATEQYQRLTQLEHILKRPDTYIGSVERTEKQLWVYNSATESMELRNVHYVPGLYKIFDEILVNAADNKQRDKNMDAVKVTIDREKGEISVWNNGRGIPIEIHSKEKMYIPEMIFGNLLTSSNYDDEKQKVTGGRNGYGAKLCNIFSTEFSLETADSKSGKKYRQTWTKNMSCIGSAKITSNKSDDYTKVTFKPDFSKFGMDGMDDDFEAIVKRRVYDLAGTCRGVKVSLNGERIKISNFKKYTEMYTKAINKDRVVSTAEEAPSMTVITESPHARWEIGFAVSDGSFQQVSFVNSIATTSGGTHVNYIADQIVGKLLEIFNKKNAKAVSLKTNQVRNHIFLFVNCLIENPAFTSQTKEQLTTKSSKFGSNCTVSDEFLKKVAKTEVLDNIRHFAQQKADQLLKKSDGSRRARMDNPKLIDANKAGTKDGWKCTLILTEGDSAKGLAVAGRAIVGPDEFGVFPLRGKLLNVRDASIDQIQKNSEIQNIKKFLGLQHKKEYEDAKNLRYGHLMIMTDQDHDGSHIKGLLINFLQCTFPSLLKIPEFLVEFVTPIVKVWKGNPKNPSRSKSFFTIPEFETWKEANGNGRGWEYKYYKGLGTSTTDDAQVYFHDLDKHLKEFDTMQEGEDQLIDLAFSKKKADERKEWLRNFKPGTYLDHSIDKITYTDFINRELILFSMADNMRSIPNVIDGLKPGQRKVLYGCFKKNLVKDMKVVELAGYVIGNTGYHHGEVSLQQTIVGLAQTFAGSNNINCLEPSGNFGSRLQGGNDSASARYIFTRLSPFARRIFSKLDEPLLSYNTDEDKKVEPEVYFPVVPMVLINGADGIGTGWSSAIPNYNPEDIVDNLRRLFKGEEMVEMSPWFRDWHGRVEKIAPDRYKFSGIIKQVNAKEVEITELPIRVWTQDFKDRLEEIIKAEKIPSFIKDYTDYNTHVKVNFVVEMDEKHMAKSVEMGLEDRFKLSKTLATSNMVAFDENGRLKKYASVEEIMQAFYDFRIVMYQKRKAHQLSELQKDLHKMTNQARFIKMIIDGKLIVSKKKKSALVAELQQKDFKPFPKVSEAKKEGEDEPAADDEDDAEDSVLAGANDYDYLLGMAIWSLTQERVEKLLNQIGEKEEEITILTALSPKDLWNKDLDDFIAEWRFQLDDAAKRQKKAASMGRRASNKLKVGAKGPGAKKRKAMGDDPDDSDFAASKPKKVTAAAKKASSANKPFEYLKSKPAAATKPATNGVKAKPANAPNFEFDGSSDPIEIPSDHGANAASKAAKSEKTNGRQARAAAAKSFKYNGLSDSDSDNGDDMLGDVSKMVKGIGNGSGEPTPGSRPLFSTSMSRPGSSAGLPKAAPKNRRVWEVSDDETDFSKLVPQSSPRKSLSTNIVRATILSDDEDSMVLSPEKPIAKSKKAPAKPAAKPATKPASKPAAAAKAKAPKPITSKTQPAKSAKSKKLAESEDEDELQIEAADDSDNDETSPPQAAVARPSRRAAAEKRKPVYLDSEDESDGNDSNDFDESD